MQHLIPSELAGQIVCDESIMGGSPTIAGRRVTCQAVFSRVCLGRESLADVAIDLEITPKQAVAAIAYEAWQRSQL